MSSTQRSVCIYLLKLLIHRNVESAQRFKCQKRNVLESMSTKHRTGRKEHPCIVDYPITPANVTNRNNKQNQGVNRLKVYTVSAWINYCLHDLCSFYNTTVMRLGHKATQVKHESQGNLITQEHR